MKTTCFFAFFLLSKQVVGDGTLRIKFSQFKNPFPSRDSTTRCCSGPLPFCSRSCQPHFKLCYKGGTSAGSCLQPKLTQTFTVPAVVSHTIIFNDNETIFNFTFQDSAPVDHHYIKIDVIDTSGKEMDTSSPVLKSGLMRQTDVLTGSRKSLPTTLWLEWQLLCDTNWYRTDCGTFCVAQDTLIPPAHYTCNTTTGDKICNPGYENEGDNCSINIDECMSNPCQNGSTCLDGINQYTCQCSEFFTGVHCETAISCPSDPCMNNGTCQEVQANSSYICSCQLDYTGKDCETQTDDCISIPCQNGGKCTDGVLSYQCNCPDGFTGTICETEIDECSSNPCVNGNCTDAVATYHCTCPAGYTGMNCQTDIDECQGRPCQNGANCTDLINQYQCDCLEGYTGTHCDIEIDECASDPCQNNATCRDGIARFTCICVTGFTDTLCQTNIDECAKVQCRNGGKCTDLVADYLCNCPRGYEGKLCDVEINECLSNPCQHGGSCTHQIDLYNCHCYPGYTGLQCETDIDECTSNPCRNNGTCQHNVNVYDCVCSVCYTGVHCEKQLDKCFEIPTGDDSNVSGGDGVSAATVAGSVVSSSLFVLGIVIFVVVFKFGWLKGPSKAKNPNAKQSVADSMVPEKLGIQDDLQALCITIPNEAYASQDGRTSSAIYEDPEAMANESGINLTDNLQTFSVTIPNEAYVSQDVLTSSVTYEDIETVANESGISLVDDQRALSITIPNVAYGSQDPEGDTNVSQ